MQLEIKHLLIILAVLGLIFFPVGMADLVTHVFDGIGTMLRTWFH